MRSMLAGMMAMGLAACGGPVGEGDGVLDADEIPEVGWVAELTTHAHDTAGRAVIIDEDTIELQDFVYDGGGINARFYLLVGGQGFDRDIELTDNLVGSPADGDTLTLPLPEGVGFEDFNLITLWCVTAGQSFGDGVFEPPE